MRREDADANGLCRHQTDWREHCDGCESDHEENASFALLEIGRLKTDNARLRALVKAGCKAGEDLVECPWCIHMHSDERNQRAARLGTIGNYIHALDCPAFTPEGEVR